MNITLTMAISSNPRTWPILDGTRLNIKGKGEYVKNTAIGRIMRDCLITCTFLAVGPPDKQVIGNKVVAEMLTSLFGEPWSVEDLIEVGTRIICQERLFNGREGMTREHDTLPARLLKEPKPDGPTKGAVVPLEELKDDFYRAMGFDLSTGNPPDSLLSDLGIEK